MHREYGSFFSSSLLREMEHLWFGHGGLPVVLFPTSQGRFYQMEDFGIVGALANKIDAGEIQLICVDSVDGESWYNNNIPAGKRALRHELYDHYIRHEIVPYIEHRIGRSDMATFGASFGAYHAANVAGRYPEVFRKAILFSGVYDIHSFINGYWDDRCYFHNPVSYIANMDAGWVAKLSQVDWIIATGEYDSLIDDNRGFAALLSSKGIPNHAEFWPGVFGHDWLYWKENLPRFLP